jgi:hypothetical protein
MIGSPEHRPRRLLNAATVLGVVDAALLVPLLIAAAVHHEPTIDILGPLHGGLFIVLVAVVALGAGLRYWGWWFPATVVVTLGPPGSFFGEWRLRKRVRRAPATDTVVS